MHKIYLRPMTREDIQLVVDTRNDCREYLFYSEKINYANGLSFWEKFVEPGFIKIWIIIKDDIACGFIDYKVKEGEIGIKILNKYRGGIGRKALKTAFRKIREENPEAEIRASIRNENNVMINTAKKVGFVLLQSNDECSFFSVPLEIK